VGPLGCGGIAPGPMERDTRIWLGLLLLSGVASLMYEVVWIRRLGLLLGGSAVAAAVTLGAFMGGLALGAAISSRLRSGGRTYGLLEAGAACWALAFPWFMDELVDLSRPWPWARWVVAAVLLVPPTVLLGATWPVLARVLPNRSAAALYAANTTGAVLGVLGATFLTLPGLGVRGTEVSAAVLGLAVAAVAWRVGGRGERPPDRAKQRGAPVALAAAAAAGFSAMGLEVVWLRLAAVGLGSTVQTLGLVLSTFLVAVAVGAWIGRRWPADPLRGLGWSLGGLAVLSLLGAALWGQLPFMVAGLYRWGGPEAMLPGSAALAALGMGGAPVASGMAFSLAIRSLGPGLEREAGALYAANTVAGMAGAILGGLVVLPGLQVGGAVVLYALVAAVAGSLVLWRPWPALAALALAVAVPGWDARLYAVGVHLRISDFADPSADAVRRFADEGWELLEYHHGTTGAVAVGRSLRTGNVWLSINGKVDASTGTDMPTQRLSGQIPVGLSSRPAEVLVVGLASGVTAGAVLEDPRVERLTVVELEPAVVRASHHFDHVNGLPLADPRTALVVDDARAWLHRAGPTYDVIVSEPSNPWITGVSNLFTLEYWLAARQRLHPDGVMCQWLQLYGIGPDELRALVRTFSEVFPRALLFETVAGADVLLVGGAVDPGAELPLPPTLDPDGVRRFGGEGWLNTDDRPRVEWRAPRYLHYATADLNARALAEAADSRGAR